MTESKVTSNTTRALGISSEGYRKAYRDEIEAGSYTGVLQAKAWGRAACLHCYFDIPEIGKKVRLTCWRNHGSYDRKYMPVNCCIDFSEIGIEGGRYHIEVAIGKTGKMKFMNAQ